MPELRLALFVRRLLYLTEYLAGGIAVFQYDKRSHRLIHPSLISFTHESPVMMLLALVIIAALLIPLHCELEHWTKEQLIEKNREIRLAAEETIEKLERK